MKPGGGEPCLPFFRNIRKNEPFFANLTIDKDESACYTHRN